MTGYLLDTSICIALFRGNHEVERRMNSLGAQNCFICDVVVAELKYGAFKSERVEQNLEQISEFAKRIRVIPFADCIDVFCQEKLRLQKSGKPIEDFDLLIGCAAKAKGLTMVTHNVKHFEHIEGITIEDWLCKKNNYDSDK